MDFHMSLSWISRYSIPLICLFCPVLSLAQDSTQAIADNIVSFQVPGSLFTGPAAINDRMTVTGTYVSTTGVQTGFVRRIDGAITTFIVPGSGQTYPYAINDAGEIAGSYSKALSGGPSLCFVRSPDGSITTFTPATSSGSAVVTAISARGEVVGYYTDDFSTFATEYGFIRRRNGVISTIAVAGSAKTQITGINASGEATGWYLKSPETAGFVRTAQGRVTTFDLGAALLPSSINDLGTVTGYYNVPPDSNWNHDFIRLRDGHTTTFTPPGTLLTGFLGISDFGVIAGSYEQAPTPTNTASHFGFVRFPGGQISTIAPQSGWQTMVTGINKLGAIVGYYYNVTGPGSFGFIEIP
jgi:hypothetical protein